MDTFALDKQTLINTTSKFDLGIEEFDLSTREKLALTCRILFSNGHDSGLAGQITARGDREGTYYTQRLGFGLDETTAALMLHVDEDLNVLEGEGIPNPANRFHSWVYRARPDVNCIIHTHALYTAALSMLEVPLVVSHMDNCLLYDDVAFVPKWPGVPVGNEEGQIISAALGDKTGLLLSHHGLLIAAKSIEEACLFAIAFERAAKMQLLAMAAGEVQPIDPELGREARDWVRKPRRISAGFTYYARRAGRSFTDVASLLASKQALKKAAS